MNIHITQKLTVLVDLFLLLHFEMVKWCDSLLFSLHTLIWFVGYLDVSYQSLFLSTSHNCCFLLAAENGSQHFPPFVLHEQFDRNTSVAQECSTCNPASQRQWLDRNHMRCVSKRHLVASLI